MLLASQKIEGIAPPPSSRLASGSSGSRVFVVAPFPICRAGIRMLLSARDIRIVGEASGADDAVRRMQRRRADLVVLGGHCLPDQGIELLAQIKAKAPSVSVILCTASESTSHLSRAILLGCSGYVHPSAGRGDLVKSVRAVMRGECIVPPRLLRRMLEEVAKQRQAPGQRAAESLTAPEREILRLVTEGQTNRQIAEALRYSVATVKDYVQRLIQKLEVSDRTQAAVKAVRSGLVG